MTKSLAKVLKFLHSLYNNGRGFTRQLFLGKCEVSLAEWRFFPCNLFYLGKKNFRDAVPENNRKHPKQNSMWIEEFRFVLVEFRFIFGSLRNTSGHLQRPSCGFRCPSAGLGLPLISSGVFGCLIFDIVTREVIRYPFTGVNFIRGFITRISTLNV